MSARRPLRVLLPLLLVVAVALAGCSGGGSDDTKAQPKPRFERYVALGDSYSAGPLVPTSDLASGCLRSDHNYPSLLARRLKVGRFVDVTCSGAETSDLTGVQQIQQARIPPQLKAVTPATDLVTISIGGNDLSLFGTVVSTCTRLRSQDPDGAPCTTALKRQGGDLTAATRTIGRRVSASLAEIKKRAPKATVVLVGYLRLVPESGTCAQLPLAEGDYPTARSISAALVTAGEKAAADQDVDFVDMDAASQGHDICAKDPWVNGSQTDRTKALSYHPFLSGMQADAREVLAALDAR